MLSDVGRPRLKREGWRIFYKRRTGRELLASRELEKRSWGILMLKSRKERQCLGLVHGSPS